MNTLAIDVELLQGRFLLSVQESIDLAGITAVFGPSGSGKTTLLRIIAGLETSARGTIRFRDKVWLDAARALPAEARAIGMVFQDGRLFPHLDVRGNLVFPIRHGNRRSRISFDDAVEVLGLAPLLDRTTLSLSGGERQRVAIGRALLAAPALLLMDEPLSSLDRARRRELLPLIRSLPSQFGVPVLYVTHDIDELIYLANHVLLLDDGRISARGGPREIIRTSEFSILDTTVTTHGESLTVAAIGSHVLRVPRSATPVGETLRLRIDSRDVILATTSPTGLSIRNCLPATVSSIDGRSDGLVDVRLAVGGQSLTARVTADAAADLALAPAQDVYALIKTVALDPY